MKPQTQLRRIIAALCAVLFGGLAHLQAQGNGISIDYLHFTPKTTGMSDANGMSVDADWKLKNWDEGHGALALQTRCDFDFGYDSSSSLRNASLLAGLKFWLPNSGRFLAYVSPGVGYYSLQTPSVTTTLTGSGAVVNTSGQVLSYWKSYQYTQDYTSISSGMFYYVDAGVMIKLGQQVGLKLGATYEFNKGPHGALDGNALSAGLGIGF